MYFLTKISHAHSQKSNKIFDVNFLLQYIDGFFDRVWAPLDNSLHKYLLNSKSSNTANKYKALFNKWETFARDHNLTPLPANQYHVSLHLSSLLDLGSSKHSILPTVYATKFQHDLKKFQFDLKHQFIKGISTLLGNFIKSFFCCTRFFSLNLTLLIFENY